MKMIVAIIRPEQLAAVRTAVEDLEVQLTSVSQVLGFGGEPGHTELYRGREVHVRPARLRLEIAVSDRLMHQTVGAIVRAGRTGEAGFGDGNVFVLHLDECVPIGGWRTTDHVPAVAP
jgi:nitrogen regulatory protein P-II 1